MRTNRLLPIVAAAGISAGVWAVSQQPTAHSQQHQAGGRQVAEVVARSAIKPGRPAGISPGAPPAATAKAWITQHPRQFGGHPASDFTIVRLGNGAATGQTITRLQQTSRGIPVIAGEAVIATDSAGRVIAATSETLPGATPSTEPQLNATEAAAAATSALSKRWGRDLKAANIRLAVYDPKLIGVPSGGPVALVWRMTLSGPAGSQVKRDVFVDSTSGKVLNSIQMIEAALSRRVCDARSTAAQVPCTTPVRSEGSKASGNTDIDHAYDFAGVTWNFYKALGRDSVDGKGLRLDSTVHYCPSRVECPFTNAYWDGNQMVYGSSYAGADDVVAHELTHGVTQYSSNLFYYFQSGAISEGISDVFGEFVDLTDGVGNDSAAVRWKIGEDLPGGAIRDMANPPSFGDPDRTGSSRYTADTTFEDDGGVHTNSGVVNKTVSLITDGGAFNGQTITAVGVTKSIRIWYQASQLLTSGSDFAALGDALNQACSSLLGTASISSSDCDQVAKATTATELANPPVKATTPQATVCSVDEPSVIWSDSFEAGPLVGWSRGSAIGATSWWWASEKPDTALYAKDGTQNIWADDTSTRTDSMIAMTSSVLVPTGGWFRFDHSYDFEVTNRLLGDGGLLEYSTNDGSSWRDAGPLMTDGGYNGSIYSGNGGDNPLAGRQAFTASSFGYVSTRVDLSSLAGKSIRFRFRLATDSGNGDSTFDGWHVDRIKLYTCGSTDTVAPTALSLVPDTKGSVANPAPTNASSLSWKANFSEPVTGLEGSDFTLTGVSTGWSITSVSGSGAGPYTVTASGPLATDGTVHISLAAGSVGDAVSNAGPAEALDSAQDFLVDRTPPETTIDTSPSAWLRSTTASFSFGATDPGDSGKLVFECTLGNFVVGATGPRSSADSCSSRKTFTKLSQGPRTMKARSVDAAGNVDPTPATVSFTVDTLAPDTKITSGPTAGSKPRFVFKSVNTDVAAYQCRFGSEAWTACASPLARSVALKKGTHTFYVRAVDKAGNVDASPALKQFKV